MYSCPRTPGRAVAVAGLQRLYRAAARGHPAPCVCHRALTHRHPRKRRWRGRSLHTCRAILKAPAFLWSDCPKGCRCASMQEELQANTCAQRATLVLSVHNAVCPLLSAVWQGQLAPKVVLSTKRAAGSTCEAVWKVHWLQLAHWLTWAH